MSYADICIICFKSSSLDTLLLITKASKRIEMELYRIPHHIFLVHSLIGQIFISLHSNSVSAPPSASSKRIGKVKDVWAMRDIICRQDYILNGMCIYLEKSGNNLDAYMNWFRELPNVDLDMLFRQETIVTSCCDHGRFTCLSQQGSYLGMDDCEAFQDFVDGRQKRYWSSSPQHLPAWWITLLVYIFTLLWNNGFLQSHLQTSHLKASS